MAAKILSPQSGPQQLAQAVRRIWRRHPRGYGFLAARRDGQWIERAFPIDGDDIEDFFERYSFRRYDLYLCLNAFRRRRRLATYAYETCYAHVDIDAADPSLFQPPPTLLTETSPGRTQAIWEFSQAVEPAQAESVSRHLTRTYGGDAGGWSITKMLRVPGSLNHKSVYNLPRITVVHDTVTPIAAWPSVQPEITKGPRARAQTTGAEVVRDPADYDAALARFNAALRAHEPLATRKMWLIKRLLKTKDQPYAEDGPDRSHILTQIIRRLRDLGLTPEETFGLSWQSGWCKFRIDDRRDGEGDLWHEVKKAYGLV
jgi:hypothetical protein